MTLDGAGSVASLAGVAVSLVGLAIAIWHIMKLRGETRAARQAAEETRRALELENAGINLARVNERIEGLKELHRRNETARALDYNAEIRRLIIQTGVRHPRISVRQRSILRQAVDQLTRMANEIEGNSGTLEQPLIARHNATLSEIQNTLTEIESQLSQSE